jgi:hypothetical protein
LRSNPEGWKGRNTDILFCNFKELSENKLAGTGIASMTE